MPIARECIDREEPARKNNMSADREDFMDALDDLDLALDRSIEMAQRMKRRILAIRRAREDGRPLREIVPLEDAPLIVQLLTENTNLLHSYGNRVRRTEARALHREGMTMDEIAKLFGVTRQRVSALLRE
jgi:DNA primase large subunit